MSTLTHAQGCWVSTLIRPADVAITNRDDTCVYRLNVSTQHGRCPQFGLCRATSIRHEAFPRLPTSSHESRTSIV